MKTKFEEIMNWCWNHGSLDDEWKFRERSNLIPKKDLKQFLEDRNCKFDDYRYWDNGTITVEWVEEDDEDWDNLSRINICNSKTKANLKYKGKYFGDYIFQEWLKNFTDYYMPGVNGITFQFDGRTKEWREFFFKELEAAMTELNTRMALKHKKETAADNLQQIENDIDIAIKTYGDEAKQYGIKMEISNNPINTVTLSYTFSKELNYDLNDEPYLIIRKLKTGKYTMCYYNYNDEEMTKWQQFKENTTDTDVKTFLTNYFEPWYGLKNIYTNEPTFLKD